MKSFNPFIGIMVICAFHLLVSAINGGTKINQERHGEFCYTCAIYCWNNTPHYSSVECSGAFVSENRVVTSLECLNKIEKCVNRWVRGGVSAMSEIGTVRNVLKAVKIKKPDVNHTVDLGVLILRESIDSRACTIDIDDTDHFDHTGNVEISGFGDPHFKTNRSDGHLRVMNAPILGRTECEDKHWDYRRDNLRPDQFCFSGKPNCAFTNVNDAGAPVVKSRNGRPLLIGVSSYQIKTRNAIAPILEIATDVRYYKHQILNSIN